MNALGDRIRERLLAVGISQAELARRIGVTQPAINHLIRRGSGGSYHMHDLARELHTSPQYLTGKTDDPSSGACDSSLTEQELEWVRLLRALPPKDREAVLHLACTIASSALVPTLNKPKRKALKS